MKKKLSVTLLLSSLFFLALSSEKYVGVRFTLPLSVNQRVELIKQLELDHYEEVNGSVYLMALPRDLNILKNAGVKYTIVSKDPQAEYEAANQAYFKSLKNGLTERVAFEQVDQTVNNIIKTPAAFQVKTTLGGYYSFAEMNAAMDALVAAYPNLAQKFSIGQSVEGREMWCIKISDNVGTDESGEPELLYMGLHHAREAIGGASMIFLMQYLCENYTTDTRIADLVNNREFFIIPCTNPDGWEYNRSTNPNGGGQWRKNRRNNGNGTYGVDLNRNWSIDWGNCSGAQGAANCGSSSGSSDVYWGAAPFSEPESVNLREFVKSRQFVVCMDQHSVGPYYSLPFGRIYNQLSPYEDDVYTEMCSHMGKYNGMRYGNTYQTLGYEVSGGMKDWLLRGGDSNQISKVFGMTGEGANGTSTVSFWPKSSEIIQLCKGMVYQDLQMAYTAGSYVDLLDNGSVNLTSKTGSFKFKVRRIGLGDAPVTVSVIPLSNITSVGAPVTITSLPNFNDMYSDSISYVLSAALANGGNVRFAWKVETGGYAYYDTVYNIYNGTVLFTDNMEGSSATTKWTVSGGWAYTTDAFNTGAKSLAESPNNAKYSNSSTRTATCKTNMNLSGSGMALLSFWVKHRAENFRDKLQVQVSTNGRTWTAISGRTTIKEPGTADGSTVNGVSALTGIREFWTREIFDLKNYRTATALRIRFVFTSNGSSSYAYGTDAGFNIDDMIVVKGASAPSLIDISGQTEAAKNILNWNVTPELLDNTGSFLLERTVNGRDFVTIGTIPAETQGSSIFTLTDADPYKGENLYRITAVTKSGAPEFSDLLRLTVYDEKARQPEGIEQVYPNPAQDRIMIRFFSEQENTPYLMSVYNMTGQSMGITRSLDIQKGWNLAEADISGLPAGEYVVALHQSQQGITFERTFIKQ